MATFVLGGVVGAALAVSLERPPPPPPPRVVYVERSAQAPALGSREPPRTEVAGATIGNATPVAGPTTNATATSNGGTSAGSPLQAQRSQLEAERRVLDGARAALVAELPDRALEQIAMHRARFQKPLLAEERDALEIQALVRTGRSGEARDRARAFHERWPESLFDFAVDSAIASIP
jgi:hypothetical protein